MAKLTSYDKVTIREWYHNDGYTQSELAEIYGVGRSTIQRVLNEPDFVPEITYGHDTEYDGHEMGTAHEPVGIDAHSDSPPWWLGAGLLALAVGTAAFVGWAIYHAI